MLLLQSRSHDSRRSLDDAELDSVDSTELARMPMPSPFSLGEQNANAPLLGAQNANAPMLELDAVRIVVRTLCLVTCVVSGGLCLHCVTLLLLSLVVASIAALLETAQKQFCNNAPPAVAQPRFQEES